MRWLLARVHDDVAVVPARRAARPALPTAGALRPSGATRLGPLVGLALGLATFSLVTAVVAGLEPRLPVLSLTLLYLAALVRARSGFGLASARGFAEAKEAGISVESRLRPGATFVLALPAARAARIER